MAGSYVFKVGKQKDEEDTDVTIGKEREYIRLNLYRS